jgi:hypothetical protein
VGARGRVVIEDVEAGALESFEEGFRSRVCGAERQCDCGRVFYNPDHTWTWDEGEIEKLAANLNATALGWAVETIEFEGRYFVRDCDCWKARATKIIQWLRAHDTEIAAFFGEEKKRKLAEAARAPEVTP